MLSFVAYFRGKLTFAADLSVGDGARGKDAADPQVNKLGLQNLAYPALAREPAR